MQTAHRFCNSYHKDGLLHKAKIGNVHQFYLNEGDARVKSLKKFIGPYIVADELYLKPFLEENNSILSIAIYGSFASGEYGDKSDLDIFILTADSRRPNTIPLAAIETRLGREIGITVMNLAEWRKKEKNKDNFFLSIKKNNVVVWGNAI